MFAVERANMDIALFSVIASALLLWRAFPRAAAVASPIFVLAGAMAKFHYLKLSLAVLLIEPDFAAVM